MPSWPRACAHCPTKGADSCSARRTARQRSRREPQRRRLGRVYEIDPAVLFRSVRRADEEGLEVLGVFHSHTHSEAYPSPTDVAQAPDPSWHYVLVSLA